MGRRTRDDALQEVNLLDLTPARAAEWEDVQDRVVVLRPKPTGRGPRRVLDWIFYHLSARRIRLDEIGSFVWRELDGVQSVAGVAHKLREAFGDRVEPAEGRLGHLIRVLRREGLIRYPGWDDT